MIKRDNKALSLATYSDEVVSVSGRRVYRIASAIFAMARTLQESPDILPTAERHAKADLLYTISTDLFKTIGMQPELQVDVKKARRKYA